MHLAPLLILLLLGPSEAQTAAKHARRKFGAPQSDEVVEAEGAVAVAGRIRPVLQAMASSSDRLYHVWDALIHAPVDPVEFGFLASIGWGSLPFVEAVDRLKAKGGSGQNIEEVDLERDDEVEDEGAHLTVVRRNSFQDTILYKALGPVSQAARIGAAVYAIDFAAVVLNALGLRFRYQAGFSAKAGRVSFAVWATMQVSRIKSALLKKVMKKKVGDGLAESARTRLLDRALTVVLWVVAGGHVIDLLKINIGNTVKSLLAFGGMGTLVISLAMKSFAAQLVSGMVLNASDRFYEGDKVQLGDGTIGKITEMTLLHTDLRGSDEIITRLPNDQIVNQRVRNISRTKMSQVKQVLWFPIKDAMKMHDVVTAIKEEIRSSCGPELITDGSRPFRVNWRDFKSDHLEVVVDCHFNIKPSGNVYYDNKQKVLKAIAQAVHRLGVEFTLPSQICHTH